MLFSSYGFESIVRFRIDTLFYVKYVGDEFECYSRDGLTLCQSHSQSCAQQKIVFPNSNESESMSTQ